MNKKVYDPDGDGKFDTDEMHVTGAKAVMKRPDYDTSGRDIANGAECDYIASDDVLGEDATQITCAATCTGATFLKTHELTIATTILGGVHRTRTLRATWKHTHNGGTVSSRVYRNGVAVGVNKTATTLFPVFQDESDDIAGWSDADLIQLYLNRGAGGSAYDKDFEVKGKIAPLPDPTITVT